MLVASAEQVVSPEGHLERTCLAMVLRTCSGLFGILLQGGSPDMLRQRFLSGPPVSDPLERLSQEKARIEKQIRRLKGKMADLDRRIEEFQRKPKSNSADNRDQTRVIDFPTKGGLSPRG